MLRNLTVVVGMLVYSVGCTESAPVDESMEATQAEDATQQTDEAANPGEAAQGEDVPISADRLPVADDFVPADDPALMEAIDAMPSVDASGETITITVTGDGSAMGGTSSDQVITVMAPSLNPDPVYLTSETTESMNLPFSDAVRVGNMLYLSGQIGNVSGTTELVQGGIQAEARQTMEKIKTILEANGSSLDRVVKATVMLADISEWPAFNEVYVTYFPGNKPARSAFAGSGLAFGARCEVEVIATVGE